MSHREWLFARAFGDVTYQLPPTPEGKSYLTSAEVGERWRTSGSDVNGLRQSGHGPRSYRIGARVVYRVADILAFEQNQAPAGRG